MSVSGIIKGVSLDMAEIKNYFYNASFKTNIFV